MRILALAAVLATVLALGPATSSARPTSRPVAVDVYFPHGATGLRCNIVVRRSRHVQPPAVLAGAMRALLAGPTQPERAAGYGGWFSARTAHAFRSATIRAGVAHVDFRNFSRVIPNASSSCGSALLLAQLDRTATQFRTVRRAVYSFDGSRRAFYEWLQREPPRLLAHEAEPPRVVRLTARDAGRTVRAHIDDVIELRLDANASTGYAWRFTNAGGPVLRILSQHYVQPKTRPGLVGVPGKFVAALGVRAAGTRRVTLEYVRRTTHPSKPLWRFGFRVAATR